jgi:hypothetical protein
MPARLNAPTLPLASFLRLAFACNALRFGRGCELTAAIP